MTILGHVPLSRWQSYLFSWTELSSWASVVEAPLAGKRPVGDRDYTSSGQVTLGF